MTQNVCHVFFYTSISTHTSRVGCDSRMQLGFSCIFISTHTSRVGCDAENISKKEDMEFLLTHPVWDVTAVTIQYSYLAKISTHTSRVGCDSAGIPLGSPGYIFLLTHPVWDVTIARIICSCFRNISTHTSRVGCDPAPSLPIHSG